MTLGDFIATLKLPFRKDRELYRSFHRILGFYPNDIRPYKQALLHKSMAVKADGRRQNNERLEFLGDAILDAVVGDIVYRHFRQKPEGFLTNTRSKIVQRDTLNKIAVEVGLDKLIKSNGRAQSAHNSYLCGNAFEALVGAVYLDRGYGHCMRFMEKQILKHLINIDKVAYKEVNFKSKLLEWGQKNRITIDFELVREDKEDGTTPVFVSRVMVEGIDCGQGKGYSKKESQQQAAKDALYRLRKKKSLEEQIFLAKGKRTAMEEQPQAMLPEIPMDEAPMVEKTEPKKQNEAAPSTEGAERKSKQRSNSRQRRRATTKKDAEPATDAADTSAEKPAAEEQKTEQKPQEEKPRKPRAPRHSRKPAEPKAQADGDVEIDFSDVSMRPKSRDEIIAEAEAQAFQEQ